MVGRRLACRDAPRLARSSLNPRERLLEVRSRGLSDVLVNWPRHGMRDAVPPCGMTGGGAGTAPDAARAAPGTRPADPAAPDLTPTRPEATRAGRHGRPPCPNALNDPSHHTRETHSDALATTPRTRRTRPSRPPPQPPRPTSSKPPLNDLPWSRGRASPFRLGVYALAIDFENAAFTIQMGQFQPASSRPRRASFAYVRSGVQPTGSGPPMAARSASALCDQP